MKLITNYLFLILFSVSSILNAQSGKSATDPIVIKDIFGRTLNDYQVTLVDWQGALANPFIKLSLSPPSAANYPLEVKIEATKSPRLMLDSPSENSASGAIKTVTFSNSSDIKDIKLTIAPDRDGQVNGEYSIESYELSLTYNNKKQTVPIKVIDQDDNLKATFPFEVDFSPDSKGHPENKYLFDRSKSLFGDEQKDKANRSAVEQAVNDWFYFFKDPGYDEVALNGETANLPGGPTKWDENRLIVKNKKAYKGFYLFVRTNYDGIHSANGYGPLWSTGYPIESVNQKINGVSISADIPRAGVLVIENADQLPIYNRLDNDEWNKAKHGDFNDLYGLTMHELGHTIVFESRINTTKKYKESTDKKSLASRIYNYQGITPELDDSYHIAAPGNIDRLSGQTGGWGGVFPQRRWLLTKLALLFAEQAGWELRTDLQPFMEHSIVSGSILPNAKDGMTYRFQFEATGGVPFYDWKIEPVELPKGLSFNRFTGELIGTPIIENNKRKFEFTVKLRDYDERSSYKEKKFTLTIESTGTVTDVDGNTYKTVKIGDQTWMTENLKVTKCTDGQALQVLEIGASASSPAMYWHDNSSESENSEKYGPLYNWSAVKDCDVCPTGWHVPSKSEWNLLLRHWYNKTVDGGTTIAAGAAGLTFAAYQLRQEGDKYWSNNEKATNSTGFSARPGGWLTNGKFQYLGSRNGWWATEKKKKVSLMTKIAGQDSGIWIAPASSNDAVYIRCLKDN